jgi:iron complex outermembrane recepter protein
MEREPDTVTRKSLAQCTRVAILLCAAVNMEAHAQSAVAPTSQDEITVYGVRPTDAGPLPGLMINRDQIPANVQSAGKKDLRDSHALNLADFMGTELQGVSVDDYSGNPFQLDVNYRGFTASPEVGTPQGLSVFFDGVRVNEPFGDIVNWDLIPLNAIERFDLFPGSNPLYGLNTLGGALSLRTKSGFTSPGVDTTVSGGSFGRRQAQVTAGDNNGTLGGLIAAQYFDEDGWRDNSPSKVRQVFARSDWRGDLGVLTATGQYASNDLIGNGLIPYSLYLQRPESVFSSPDESQNRLLAGQLSGSLDVTDHWNIAAQGYHRRSDRRGLNGDVYQGFQDFSIEHDYIVDPSQPIGQQIVGRNGADTENGQDGIGTGTGVIAGTPIGLLTYTDLSQNTNGGAVQSNWNLEHHHAMFGLSIDGAQTGYSMSQRLGLIDGSHNVYSDPADIDPQYYAASHDIPGNNFHGSEMTKSAFFNETWSIRKNLHLTVDGRYNFTHVTNDLMVRTDQSDLHELRTGSVNLDQEILPQTHTRETYDYSSFNPQLGLNYLPVPQLNLYANASRGSRVPSVVELGCAFDSTPVNISVGNVTATAPRSLVGPGCSLPTTLSGDPYLPQIRSESGEAGARGHFDVWGHWNWDLTAYRTNLKNDIYFVGVGDGKSYFDTIGDTRRQGFEVGLNGNVGIVELKFNYAYTLATFESTFYTVSPYNSSADFNQNSQSALNQPGLNGVNALPSPTAGANRGRGTYEMIRIDPGARLPGIPEHTGNMTLTIHPIDPLALGIGVTARSDSYVRGNENNLHAPGGTDQQIGEYYCTQGGGCAGTGLQQVTVPKGRPFTDSGKVPGFATVNLDASYRFFSGFSGFVRVMNLFDRQYFTAGQLGINPFAPSVHGAIGSSGWNYNSSEWQNSTFVGPGAPRAVFVGVTYEFDAR